jgi:hypothetical protein
LLAALPMPFHACPYERSETGSADDGDWGSLGGTLCELAPSSLGMDATVEATGRAKTSESWHGRAKWHAEIGTLN